MLTPRMKLRIANKWLTLGRPGAWWHSLCLRKAKSLITEVQSNADIFI